jgi:hypothetical protein
MLVELVTDSCLPSPRMAGLHNFKSALSQPPGQLLQNPVFSN